MSSSSALGRPLATTIALFVPLALLDKRMQQTGGPGIIAFELAGPERSSQVLRRWGPKGRHAAVGSLVLDFPFLASYTTLNVRLARWAQAGLGRVGARPPAVLAPVVSATYVAAGACDALENAALLGVICRNGHDGMARVARVAAQAKFGALFAGWLYVAVAVARVLRG